jgi:hypothetical protein
LGGLHSNLASVSLIPLVLPGSSIRPAVFMPMETGTTSERTEGNGINVRQDRKKQRWISIVVKETMNKLVNAQSTQLGKEFIIKSTTKMRIYVTSDKTHSYSDIHNS